MWQRAKIIAADAGTLPLIGKLLWLEAGPPLYCSDLAYRGVDGRMGRMTCSIYKTHLVHEGRPVYALAGRVELLNEFAENVEMIEL